MGFFDTTKTLDCWYVCNDLYECMRDTKRPVFEIQCSECRNGNRFRVLNGLWGSRPMFNGTTRCQMGKVVQTCPKEMCDACRAEEKRKEEHYRMAREIVKDNALVKEPIWAIPAQALGHTYANSNQVIRAEHEDKDIHKTYGGLVIPTNQEVVEIGLGIYRVKKELPQGEEPGAAKR